jgi:hypothetical protein
MFSRWKLALGVVAALLLGAAIVGVSGRDSSKPSAPSASAQSKAAKLASSDQPATVTVPIERAAAEVERLSGNRVRATSCLVRFAQPDCPAISEVVIVLAGSEEGDTDFVPLVTADPSGAVLASAGTGKSSGLASHGLAAACGVIAYQPVVNVEAYGTHKHHCLNGQGITYMELDGWLKRWNATDKRWYNLDSCSRTFSGATEQTCGTSYNCYHPSNTRAYKGRSEAFAVQNGKGFWGYDVSPTEWDYCD